MGKSEGVRHLNSEREAAFPNLASSDYEVTSTETTQYNCIAHAADDHERKWDCAPFPIPGYYWPRGAMRGDGLDALISAFETLGYTVCDSDKPEPGVDKVALYIDGHGEWAHAAKQRDDGHWSSKLGDWEDIRHASVTALEKSVYGTAVRFMERPATKKVEAT